MFKKLNYQKSKQILKEIKRADKILLNCHRGPDPDSIGSTLAMQQVLRHMGKTADIICPSRPISRQVDYLPGFDGIKLGVDFGTFDFSEYDLFLTLDTPNLSLMTNRDVEIKPKIRTIVIDHHHISTLNGIVKLLDEDVTSLGEMLYRIFEDWKIKLDKNIADCLLASIIGDTGAFAYPNVTSNTLLIASKLMALGADKNTAADRIYRTENFEMLKFWSKVLGEMKIDREHKFVYSFISHEDYKEFSGLDDAKAKAASLFAPIVDGTNFGFIGVEEKERYVTISFRGRTDFDTSVIAKELGGGGHKVASAAKIEKLPFHEVVGKVLKVARKYAKKD